ncbi:MAG: O-antigen ligase family protein, partial [Campylobacterota bacterium]|nr:O-antigen ligase family protein [Campylobacterota bacterium]
AFKNIETVTSLLKQYKDILLAFMLIVFSMILSSVLGVNLADSLSQTMKFIYRYIFLFIVLLYFFKMSFFTRKFVITMIVVTCTIYAMDGLYQYFTGYDMLKNIPIMYGGLTGPLFNRNIFGFIMAIGAIVSFALLFSNQQSKLLKLLLIGIFLLILFNLIFSLARAPWVFFMVYALCFLVYMLKQSLLSKQHLYLIFAVISLAILVFLSNDELMVRFNQLIEGHTSKRFDLWMDTVPFILQHLWFGYGIDTFTIVVTDKFSGLHNAFIEIALFLGLVGLLVYFNFLRVIFMEIYKINQYSYGFFLLGFLVLLQFDGSLVYSKLNLSVLVILMFLIYSHRFEKVKVDDENC